MQVTGVDHHTKLDLLESLGYDRVVDYETIDFTAEGILYDLILDAKTNRPPQNYTRALKPGGSYVTVGGELSKLIALMFYSLFSKKSLGILALKPNEHLQEIIRLYGEGKLQCILDGPHPFQDIPRLTGYFGEGKHRGKIVVKVED